MYHMKPALSQIEYLEKKLAEIDQQIQEQSDIVSKSSQKITDLFFQKGKIYSELELMKRVRPYED